MFNRLGRAFFFKNGKLSKTAIILSVATFIVLGLYIFQSLFGGVTLLGWWLVPEFSPGAATSIMGVLATLYVANHSRFVTGEDGSAERLANAREEVNKALEAVKGDE